MDLKLRTILKGNAFSGVVKKALEDIQKKYGLKHVELEVLYFLAEFPEYDTPSVTAEQLMLTRGHVSQALDALLEAGLVIGKPDEKDRRSMHYAPTAAAQPIIDEISNGIARLEEKLFDGIDGTDREVFERIISQVMKNAETITEELENHSFT